MDLDDETFEHEDEDEIYLEGVPGVAAQPDFRAVVQRSGAVRVAYWGAWLVTSGPAYTLIGSRTRSGVGVADLTVVRDEDELAVEVIVQFLAGGDVGHKLALTGWASAAGYRRVWFDGEVVELEPAAGGLVSTRCTGCGTRFVDGRSDDFWRHVRLAGIFPPGCALCGSDLPQWAPVGGASRAGQTDAASSEPKEGGRRRSEHVRVRRSGPLG